MKLAKSFRRAQIIWSLSGIILLLVMAAMVRWALVGEAAVGIQINGIEAREGNVHDAVPPPLLQTQQSRKHSHVVSSALQLAGPEYLEMRDR